jgi:hypothetical protein
MYAVLEVLERTGSSTADRSGHLIAVIVARVLLGTLIYIGAPSAAVVDRWTTGRR